MKREGSFSWQHRTTFRWCKLFQYFLVAWHLLTTIPLYLQKKPVPEKSDVANATVFFPLVGFIIGSLLFLIYLIFNRSVSSEITSIFILGGWILLTGALHIDGLADTIDGLSGGKNKNEILHIMRDAHIGAKGTVGIILLLMIKYLLILQLTSSPGLRTLICAPVLARWGVVIGCYAVPYVREEGMGGFFSLIGFSHIMGATLITLVLGILLVGPFFLIPLVGVGGFSLIWSLYLKRKIGGFTGDTLGALTEMGEVVALSIASFG